jgi:spore germination cell wall hydrolase CwlJ-like protein
MHIDFLNQYKLFLVLFLFFGLDVPTQAKQQHAGFLNAFYVETANNTHLVSQDTLTQLDCLAKNIFWEAANESFEGKVAVAQVTMNRLHSGRHGNSVCHVVYQRQKVNNVIVCQFSWTCTSKRRINPHNRRLFKESEEVAKQVYLENLRLTHIRTALYFHSNSINPRWRKVRVAQIGRHIFYRD